MDYEEENSQSDGYMSDIDIDEENYQSDNETQNGPSVPELITDNNSDSESLMAYDGSSIDPESDLADFHNRMHAIEAMEFHNINEIPIGPIDVRISAFKSQTVTITQDELDHLKTPTGAVSVIVDGARYTVAADYQGRIRCLTEHYDIEGQGYYENEAGIITDIEDSSGEE